MQTLPLARSLWSALSEAAPACPPLNDEIAADVAIIGGGFLGLTTALHLAEAGVATVLLEADEVGYGASGRNTGFVVPSFRTGLGPAEVEAAVGPIRAEGLTALVQSGGDTIFGLIERLGIACSAERVGWLQPAHTADYAARLQLRVRQMAGRGRPVSWLSAAETEKRTGIRGYHGALFDASGGQINPLAYVRGLAAAASAAGAKVHGGSRARAVTADGKGWRVTTDKGSVRASTVLLATNALVGSLVPDYGRGFVPVHVHQIATQPLGADAFETILPAGAPLSDTRRHTFAVRRSPDNRLVTGGIVMAGPGVLARAARTFVARLGEFFPGAPALRADYIWDGVIASTAGGLPTLTTLAPGLHAAIGCNGRGVALSAAVGAELARTIAAGSIADTVLVTDRPPDIPFQRIVSLGPSLWLPWSTFRDWLDTRQGAGGGG